MSQSDFDSDPDDVFDDDSRFSRRVKRYAQVGGQVGGLAAQLAGTRLFGRKLDAKKHSGELRDALGGLKGPLMKAAQILATIPEALPEDYARELRQLQHNAPPMGWAFVRRRMRTELGAGWEKKFARFDKEAAAAASLGQVHRGLSHDGRDLAIKLQYPDMASNVEADVEQLRWAFRVYRQYDSTIDTSDIYKELVARLHEELDYEREGRHIALYRLMLAEEPNVRAPEPLMELTAIRISATTPSTTTPRSTCWTSAVSGCSVRPSSRALSTSITPCATMTTTSPSRPIRPGVSARRPSARRCCRS